MKMNLYIILYNDYYAIKCYVFFYQINDYDYYERKLSH